MKLEHNVDAKAIYAEQAKRYSGKELLQATRVEVHQALQLALPHTPVEQNEDPDDVHMRQKAHGKSLWKEADRLIAEAGIK